MVGEGRFHIYVPSAEVVYHCSEEHRGLSGRNFSLNLDVNFPDFDFPLIFLYYYYFLIYYYYYYYYSSTVTLYMVAFIFVVSEF